MALYFIHTLQLPQPARPQRLRRALGGAEVPAIVGRSRRKAVARAPRLPSVAVSFSSLRASPPSPSALARPSACTRVLHVGLTGGFILPVIIERYFGDLLLFYGVTRRCAEIMLPGDSSEWHMRNEPRKDGRDCSVGPAISQRWSCLC